MWKSGEEAAETSCLYSILEVVNKATKAGKLQIPDKAARELTQTEIERLLENQGLDCRNKSNLSRKVHVAVGDVNEHTDLKMKVWTNGDDEIAGTDDDLVVPFGEKVK